MAWNICTNRAGVWIVRPTLVVLAGTSAITLSLSAIVETFLTFNSVGNGGGSRMWRYIRFKFVRQFLLFQLFVVEQWPNLYHV